MAQMTKVFRMTKKDINDLSSEIEAIDKQVHGKRYAWSVADLLDPENRYLVWGLKVGGRLVAWMAGNNDTAFIDGEEWDRTKSFYIASLSAPATYRDEMISLALSHARHQNFNLVSTNELEVMMAETIAAYKKMGFVATKELNYQNARGEKDVVLEYRLT